MKNLKRREITLIYQDCATCGSREAWGKVQLELADKLRFKIREMPFSHPDAGELIVKAVDQGIGKMPFYTDGEKFSYTLEDFVEKPIAKKGKKEKRVDGDIRADK